MEISCGSVGDFDIVAHFVFEGEKPKLAPVEMKIADAAMGRKEFEGKAGTSLVIRAGRGASVLLGLGKKEEFELDILREAAAKAALFGRESRLKFVGVAFSAQAAKLCGGARAYAEAVCEGAHLSLYKFDKYREKDNEGKSLEALVLQVDGRKEEIRKGMEYAKAVCEASAFARDIANESGDAGSPAAIAEAVRKMAGRNRLKYACLSAKECRKLGMGAFLSVSAGSEKEPKFVVLRHKPTKPKGKVCLVGKGVTFDSGGISIKGGKDMDKMKHDKCGAAAVFGALMAAAKLKLPVEVVGIAPLVENMPSGSAIKPGDIVRAANGKTIEVQNTDAEGRLILADALVFAQKEKPDAIVDLATLTGAVSVALGSQAAGLLGNRQWLNVRLEDAGNCVHERVWELPLWKEYGEQMKGEFSDLKNISGDGEAGTITAASFLSNFSGETPWAHIDIAGTAYSYKPKPYFPQVGANGFGVRLLAKMLSAWEKPPLQKKTR